MQVKDNALDFCVSPFMMRCDELLLVTRDKLALLFAIAGALSLLSFLFPPPPSLIYSSGDLTHSTTTGCRDGRGEGVTLDFCPLDESIRYVFHRY